MVSGLFITGTDTGVGKTWISCGLIAALCEQGISTAGMKPVASGCELTPEGLRNEDVIRLVAQSDPSITYHDANCYSFAQPIAPHIAAMEAGITIDLQTILQARNKLRQKAQCIIVEGVGGWRVPLNEREDVSDLAKLLEYPVVLVVGLRLGCINHALLTARAIQNDGLQLTGWIANQIEPGYTRLEETVTTLERRIDAPLLGLVQWQEQWDRGKLQTILNPLSHI